MHQPNDNRDMVSQSDAADLQASRRNFLKCGAWAGAGLIWTVAGGIPRSTGLGFGAPALAETAGFSFVQISDSHIGFNKAPNPDAPGTFREAVGKVRALGTSPAFMIHTGDVSHLSKPEEFDTAAEIIKEARLDVHYVPGEHDVIGDDGKAFFERFSKNATGWYSFDQGGVHFIALVNVLGFKAGGYGHLGDDQLKWLEADVKSRAASTPIVVFTHIPLWMVYADWGWGTDDAAQALGYLKRFGSVTVLNGHIHQIIQKVEGNVSFHTANSTAFPQPAPGTAPNPGPLKVEASRLKSLLGIREVNLVAVNQPLAIIDTTLNA
ncbi:MAG TPA: metallophosphoesterase [Dongiaceae bacterium]|nr:metallophosphoesterase [Dongiaceae bacterium]